MSLSKTITLGLVLSGWWMVHGALAQNTDSGTTSPQLTSFRLQADEQPAPPPDQPALDSADAPAPTAAEEGASNPLTFSIRYALFSDYIFRGINFSDFPAEGDEDVNHQMSTSVSYSFGEWGTFGFDTWFEWYAAQDEINPYADSDLQEVDLTVWYSHPIDPIATNFKVGWTHFNYPGLSRPLNLDRDPSNNHNNHTHEWWFRLDHNDAWMWKWLWPDNEEGILNPSFFYAMDCGIGSGTAQWMEVGLSHKFALTEDLSLTPSWTLGIDHNYYKYFTAVRDGDHTTRLATMVWGLDLTYDLTKLLQIPDPWGSIALSGLLYYSDALGNAYDNGTIKDEFYGGFAVTYSFGG
ncbi:MAG: hypothetical protein HJJLKODD_02254 [Phycisphaerae bacterium]|nr:hypothetical protein [Phycisphaerae bacterium]